MADEATKIWTQMSSFRRIDDLVSLMAVALAGFENLISETPGPIHLAETDQSGRRISQCSDSFIYRSQNDPNSHHHPGENGRKTRCFQSRRQPTMKQQAE